MGERTEVRFEVNGREVAVKTWPMGRLLDVLRTEVGLTGTKEGCGEGECGACSVLVDGVLVNACLVPVVQVAGCSVQTVEGLAEDAAVEPLRQAFVRANGAQCGICTPGMLMATVALLREEARPSDARIREALGGNLCRCTGYVRIVQAVREAAAEMAGARADAEVEG